MIHEKIEQRLCADTTKLTNANEESEEKLQSAVIDQPVIIQSTDQV